MERQGHFRLVKPRSASVRGPVGCALMSGLSHGVRRWPSWVCACVSGANLVRVLAARHRQRLRLSCLDHIPPGRSPASVGMAEVPILGSRTWRPRRGRSPVAARPGRTRQEGSDLVRSLRRIGPPGAVGADLDQDEAAFLLVIGRPRRVRPNRAGSRAPRRRRTSLPAPSRACPLLQAWRRSGTGLGSRPSGKATTRSPTRWKVRSTIAPPTTRRRIVSRSMPVGSRGRST